MEITIFIYALIDIRFPNDFRYIGVTRSLQERKYEHRINSSRQNTKKAKWIKEVLSCGSDIEIILVNSCSSMKVALEKEKYFISLYKEHHDLVNSTSGGQGTIGFKHSKESRAKMSKNLLGGKRHTKPHSEESKKKMSLTKIGKKPSQETKVRMSLSHLGQKRTEEQKENMRKAWILRKQK